MIFCCTLRVGHLQDVGTATYVKISPLSTVCEFHQETISSSHLFCSFNAIHIAAFAMRVMGKLLKHDLPYHGIVAVRITACISDAKVNSQMTWSYIYYSLVNLSTYLRSQNVRYIKLSAQ